MINPISDLRRLRSEHNEWLLTALAGTNSADICLRPAPGSWYYSLSSICYRPLARDHGRHGDYFR